MTAMAGQNADVAAIKRLAKAWHAAWNRGDAEALCSLYAQNPVLMPQGQPAVTGKKAIRSLYRSFFEAFTVKGRGKVIEIEVSGDLGYFRSSYTLTAAPKAGGDPIKGEGRSVFILKRQSDNSWKIARLIDNSARE